jgi:DNA-binding PadR family transcriptional regulator
MKVPQGFLKAAHQEEIDQIEEILERGVKLGHFERKIDRRGVKSYRITPLGEAWFARKSATSEQDNQEASR